MKLPLTNSGSGGSNSYHPYDQIDPIEMELDSDEITISSDSTEEDFTEYMWMEDEEEFDKSEMKRLEEEALIQECMENMLEDDQYNEAIEHEHIYLWQFNYDAMSEEFYNGLTPVQMVVHYDISNSKLNPLAKEFVPSSVRH